MKKKKQDLTHRQYGTLVWLNDHVVMEEHLRGIHQITLWSLLHQGFVMRGAKGTIQLSPDGEEIMRTYRSPHLSSRNKPSDLSGRVSRLLAHVRALRRIA